MATELKRNVLADDKHDTNMLTLAREGKLVRSQHRGIEMILLAPRRSLLDARVEGSKHKAAAPSPLCAARLPGSCGCGAGTPSLTSAAIPAVFGV